MVASNWNPSTLGGWGPGDNSECQVILGSRVSLSQRKSTSIFCVYFQCCPSSPSPPFSAGQRLVFNSQFSLSAVDFGERVKILGPACVFVHWAVCWPSSHFIFSTHWAQFSLEGSAWLLVPLLLPSLLSFESLPLGITIFSDQCGTFSEISKSSS